MKTEKEIISQIRILKEIKPDADWAILAKMRIMGQEETVEKVSMIGTFFGLLFRYRIAVAGMLLAGVSGGVLAFAQNALPGEALYSLKRATEKGFALASGRKDNPAANLQLAAKRLEEINLLSQRNQAKNLSAAFYEYRSAKAEAKKEVAALVKINPSKATKIIKEAGEAMKVIDEKEKTIYAVLGLDQVVGDESEIELDKTIAESLINYFKKETTLSEDQENDLVQVKSIFGAGEYGRAVDYYLNSSLNK